MEKYITAKKIIENLDISYGTLKTWIKEGKFPNSDVGKKSGEKKLWKESTIIEWQSK